MTEETEWYPYNSTLGAISVPDRRAILAFLLDQESRVNEVALAQHLAISEANSRHPTASAPETQSVHGVLVHDHLPALADASLIEWDRDAETVGTSTHPALADPRFKRLLHTEITDCTSVLSVLAHDHRRIALTVLRAAPGSVTRRDLAREILRYEIQLIGRNTNTIDDLLVSLHHNHLPQLVATDLIEYDSTMNRATYAGHPGLERVFSIVVEPDDRAARKLDGFLQGLSDSYHWVSRDTPTSWPHHWRNPSHG